MSTIHLESMNKAKFGQVLLARSEDSSNLGGSRLPDCILCGKRRLDIMHRTGTSASWTIYHIPALTSRNLGADRSMVEDAIEG